jgi:glycerol-3-phosphate dehydrogenase (NAD(P)+)
MNILILGAGAWGSALAHLLTHNGHTVTLWVHDAALAMQPHITTDMQAACAQAEVILVAIPCPFIRSVMQQVRSYCRVDQPLLVASKGIELETDMLPTQIIMDVLGDDMQLAALSGPSFAHDLVQQQLTGMVVATTETALGLQIAELFRTTYVRIDLSDDIIGVQVGGALKNCAALAVGLLEGAGCTDNTRALFVTRCLQEIVCIGTALGAQERTLYGLAGIGDLLLTTMSSKSRNVVAGKLLAQGVAVDDLFAHMGAVAEGVNTIAAVEQLVRTRGIDAPLHRALHAVVFSAAPLQSLLDLL